MESNLNKVLRNVSNKSLVRGPTADAQLVTKRQVKDMIKSLEFRNETKIFDTSLNAGGVDFSGTLAALSNMSQGDSKFTRDGDEAELVSLDIRGNWSAGDATQLVRLLIFQYFPQNAPLVGTFLQSTGTGFAPISPLRYDTQLDYACLYDSGPVNLVLGLDNTVKSFVVKNIKPKRSKMVFNTAATTGSNQLYAVYISDSGAVPNPSLSYYMRLYFQDS